MKTIKNVIKLSLKIIRRKKALSQGLDRSGGKKFHIFSLNSLERSKLETLGIWIYVYISPTFFSITLKLPWTFSKNISFLNQHDLRGENHDFESFGTLKLACHFPDFISEDFFRGLFFIDSEFVSDYYSYRETLIPIPHTVISTGNEKPTLISLILN